MKIKGMTLDGYRLVIQDGGKEVERTCPKCHKRKPLSKFGLRSMTGKKEIRNQSLCTDCRGE
jgi:hypothetical protein